MPKYNIEGEIDFYSELYGSLEQTDCEDENVCLITNEPLIDLHVKMNCGHSFNYEPLYKDLVNHLTKFNNMEGSTGVLGKNEIRCPYCRSKQKGVLPYYPELGLKRVEGVNTACVPPQICSFIWDNENFDEEHPENFVNPKTIKCTHIGSKIMNDGEKDVFYCVKHNKHILNQQAKALKEKQKQDKLDAKLKEKQDKAAAKAVAAADKALANAYKKSLAKSQNVVESIFENGGAKNESLCVEILKSGDRKGHQCSFSKMDGHDQCKRHYNLLVKKNL
jgi:hypothetical protein